MSVRAGELNVLKRPPGCRRIPWPGGLPGSLGFTDAASKYSGTLGSGAGTEPAGALNDCACGRGAVRTTRAIASAVAVSSISLRIGTPRIVLRLDTGRVPLVCVRLMARHVLTRAAMDVISIPTDEWRLAGRLALAALLGGILGLNREIALKPAGLRTHALVALGAALVTVTGL